MCAAVYNWLGGRVAVVVVPCSKSEAKKSRQQTADVHDGGGWVKVKSS
jgi:hypothetical protein